MTSVDPLLLLNNIANQMCSNQSFSQRNRTAERIVGVGVGGDREGKQRIEERWRRGKRVKKGGRQYREVFIK